MKTVYVVAALLSFVLPCTALAQDAAPIASEQVEMLPPPPSSDPSLVVPGWRLDVLVPNGGAGYFTAPAGGYEEAIALISAQVRMVERYGSGAMVRGSWATNGWGGAYGLDVDYVFRARLVGNDVLGLGVDLNAGVTFADLHHNVGTVPTGFTYGGNAGASLDFRCYNFVLSLGVQYRVLTPTQAAPNGGPTDLEHAFTATLGGGFGFWGQ